MRHKAILAALGIAVCAFYFWAADHYTERSPNGYYNYLTRGWLSGHLHVPIAVNPKLLAMANPYDPKIADELKVHDMALYKGRYFLYHGPAPVVLAFLPYSWLTGRDLPETRAVAWLAALCFAFLALTLYRWNPAATPLHYLALGLASGIPFLLHRIWVYEVAIMCGCACLAAAICCHAHNWHRLSGVAMAFAILSRPHLAIVLVFLSPRSWPTAALGLLASLLHNYLRFDSPFEFGLRFLLAGPGQQQPSFHLQNIVPSLYLFLMEVPHLVPSFPFLKLHNTPWITLPPGFFHENMVGAIWLCPFLLASKPLWRPMAMTASLLLFLSTTGWVTERYLLDFLPLLVLASLASKARPAVQVPLLVAGILVNLALYVQGPYNAP
jgi:hypothetical protein